MECVIPCEMDTELTQKHVLWNTNHHMHRNTYICLFCIRTHTETEILFIQFFYPVCFPLTSYFLYIQTLIFKLRTFLKLLFFFKWQSHSRLMVGFRSEITQFHSTKPFTFWMAVTDSRCQCTEANFFHQQPLAIWQAALEFLLAASEQLNGSNLHILPGKLIYLGGILTNVLHFMQVSYQ